MPSTVMTEAESLAAFDDVERRLTYLEDREPSITEVTQAEIDAIVAAGQAVDKDQSEAIARIFDRMASIAATGNNPDNAILLDSYDGTDDERLTKAMFEQRNSSPKRAIRLSARRHTFTQPGHITYSGFRLLGPAVGWQNPELGGGDLPQCIVNIDTPKGSPWLVGAGRTDNTAIVGITFKSKTEAFFYHHPYSANTAYGHHMADVAFYGFQHVLGSPNEPFSMTLNTWAGCWTHVAVKGTQFSLRGSDNFLQPTAMNYGWPGDNGGQALMRLSNLAKTKIRNLYLTARGNSKALLIEGPTNHQGGLDIADCVLEGQNANDPAWGCLVDHRGGYATISTTSINFGMSKPSTVDTALVMVRGGTLVLDKISTCAASGAGAVPLARNVGGKLMASLLIPAAGTGNATYVG